MAVAPALGDDPRPDPVFVLFGGPGVAASRFAVLETRRWKTIRHERDLVFVDLRGTGHSNALDFPPLGPPENPATW